MPLPVPTNPDPFRRLEEIMDALLSPEGCPWDKQQDHRSLKPYVIEEAYEVYDAIDEGDMDELKAELGDLGLQIIFHSALAKREKSFNVDDVYQGICDKLIRRHPHVFADRNANDAETVLKNWEQIKREERAEKADENRPPSALDGVPKTLPALQKAHRIQSKAARVGFDWKDVKPVIEKIHEEIDELAEAHGILDGSENQHERVSEELGDLLFAIVNLSRFLKVDPELALHDSNRKFVRRFHFIEEKLRERNKLPGDSTLEEMDELWNQAKAKEKISEK